MEKGKIIKAISGFFYVKTERGLYECKGRGILRKEKIKPLVGDMVEISVKDGEKKEGTVEKVLSRKNQLLRPEIVNVDQVIVVLSSKNPGPSLMLTDKIISLAEWQELSVVLCLNKADLLNDEDPLIREVKEIYEPVGYPLVLASTKKAMGIEELSRELQGKVSVFAGPSGVGKSSLLNAIKPGLSLKTGEVSERIQRGKHTTRHTELMEISEDSWVADTPGFGTLDLDEIPREDLRFTFRDFLEPMEECKFLSCLHLKEPHCGVKQAVEAGNIAKKRYEHYKNFMMDYETKRSKRSGM